ncbi:hypothetical protein M569_10660, partial [Genlisea aurea]
GFSFLQGNGELAAIFLEWLKQNRDSISAEDMRSIKLKRSTIESASKRLGSDTEGKKQLLKLILEWVEQHQLQKKRMRELGGASHHLQCPYQQENPNFQPYAAPLPPPVVSPYHHHHHHHQWPPMSGGGCCYVDQIPMLPLGTEFQTMQPHHQSWPAPPYAMGGCSTGFGHAHKCCSNQQGSAYVGNHPYGGFDASKSSNGGCSATKEARKKRMARQRKQLYNHRHSAAAATNNIISGNDSVSSSVRDHDDGDGSWMYWSSPANPLPVDPPHKHSEEEIDAAVAGWKSEKNLKFLLQKVLKQSDVGNLGRIVLPKKEAESHLPELESRDGISIAMEDIGTSRIWNMRYRFWPNNKSRMYLLENTGEFVRVNGLQEGDFIVIYSDAKSGKYMIRGVKVRQPGNKPEIKKPPRKNSR